MKKALFAALLALAATPATGQTGRYRLQEGPDVASVLVLHAGGRFDYALAAGALDEYSSGRWRKAGKRVLLTTDPKPVPPVFTAGAAAKSEAARLILHVEWAGGRPMAGPDLRIDFDTGPPLTDYINNDEGWRLPPEETRRPIAVTVAIPMYGLVSPRFPVDLAAANELTFTLTPHDMGRLDFQDLPLDIARGRLVMHRGGALLAYVREK